MVTVATRELVRELLEDVTDPEIPVLSITDLGIVRDVAVTTEGATVVTITPTYSGCPAMDVIKEDILAALESEGIDDVAIETVYAPAWTTDWMTESGRAKLEAYGIAPPGSAETSEAGNPATADVRCPQCRSHDTKVVSEFGSTACKALMVCTHCGEPFDFFKGH